MLAFVPGERVQNLTVENWCLKPGDRGRIAKRGVTWNGESREGSIAHALQANLAGQVFSSARAGIVELSAQISETNVVGQRRTEDVRVGSENTLHANIGDVAQRVGFRNAIRAAVEGVTVVDVVACRQQIGGCYPMIQPPHKNVPVESVGGIPDKVV